MQVYCSNNYICFIYLLLHLSFVLSGVKPVSIFCCCCIQLFLPHLLTRALFLDCCLHFFMTFSIFDMQVLHFKSISSVQVHCLDKDKELKFTLFDSLPVLVYLSQGGGVCEGM